MHSQKETSSYTEEIKNQFNDYFLPQFNLHIKKQVDFLKEFAELADVFIRRYQSKSYPDTEFINNLKILYYEKSYELISQKYNRRYKQNFDQDLPEFIREINSYIHTLDQNIIRVQDEERFIINNDDTFKVKFFKRFKKFFYSISQFPIQSGNIFRRLFKKPLKEKRSWYHKVPVKNLTAFYLRDNVCLNFIPHIEEVNRKTSSAFLRAWKTDEELSNISVNEKTEFGSDLYKEIEELEGLTGYLKESFDKVFSDVIVLYEDAFKKAGTLELPYNRLSEKKIEKNHKKLNEEYESLYDGWTNNFYSLFEDWRLNKELYTLNENLSFEFSGLTAKARKKFGENISPHLKEIKEFLDEVIYRFEEFSGSSSQVKALLYKEKDRISNKLSGNVIPGTSEVILTQNIPDLIDQMEYKVNSGIDTLAEKRAIVKTTTYNEKINDSDIDFISPKEIITYSALHSYLKTSSLIKSSIMQELNDIQKGLRDIDQIADFNLESALSMFKTDKNSLEDPLDIAIDGIKRALVKEESVGEKLKDIELKINNDLNEAVKNVNDELIRLTKNENVIEIKLNIARTKTLHRTEEIRQKSVNFLKNFFPIILNGIKQGFLFLRSYYNSVRNKFGFAPRVVSISTEISDFLAATENAVSRLPFVYQRLFRVEPLEDDRFFEGRENELLHLKAAFENWKLKKYAPVIVFGEKGSGITTLLNFHFKNMETNFPIIRTSINENIYSEKEFIDFLKNIFKESTFNNIEEVVKYLNNLVTKQIVVIENLQNLFLKKVNGFVCLRMFFELISKTNQNVFWIITSSLYAWEYLSKVMNVSDYFGYQVKLEKLKNEQMIDIILRRHRISGYNIYFQAPDETAVRKKYKNLSDAEVQEILKREYFSELNEFAKSNISLALLYWMRSTKEVTANTIKLGSVVELDFSFLKAMDSEKIFLLYLLLLHDGLKEDNIVEIYSKPLNEMRLSLLVLLDDGIVIRKGDLYLINPLLYRQIVYLLKSKNIIH
jgi:hypothetical protein